MLQVNITGWGFIRQGGPNPDQLQVLTTTTMSNEDCRRRMNPAFVPESKLCTNAGRGAGLCEVILRKNCTFYCFENLQNSSIFREILVAR